MLDGEPPTPNGHSPQFSTHVCCGRTAEWIKMPLGTEVDLGLGHTVLDGKQAPIPPKGGWEHVYCGQTVAHLSY